MIDMYETSCVLKGGLYALTKKRCCNFGSTGFRLT